PGTGDARTRISSGDSPDLEAPQTREAECEIHWVAVALPEDDVADSGMGPTRERGPGGPDDQVRETVPVDIARARDARAALIVFARTLDRETAPARPDLVQVDPIAARFPEDDEALAGLSPAQGIGIPRADDEVSEAVAVDVPGSGEARDREVTAGGDPADGEAAPARLDRSQMDRVGVFLPEDEVALARLESAFGRGPRRSHQEVRQSIAVQVAGPRD